MMTFSASLTHVTFLLPQSHDCSCYVNTPILAPPPLWLQKHTDLRAQDFAHSPDLWHQPRLANVTCPWSWGLHGIAPAMPVLCDHCVLTLSRATNVFKQYTMPCPLVLAVVIRNILSACLPTHFPYISPASTVAKPSPKLYSYRGADKSLARPGRKQATATEDFEFHISYL